MLNLDLKINGLEVTLGMPLDKVKFKAHKFKKPGLLSGIKRQPGQSIIWSKNCTIRCFDGEFVLAPVLDSKAGADMMYGTSAYLFFMDKILYTVIFQLVGNEAAADWFEDKFTNPAVSSFGQPTSKDFDTVVWGDSASKAMIDNKMHSQHIHFHWIKVG